MKNKKITAILTILFLSLSLCGCNGKVDVSQESSSEFDTSEEKEESESSEEEIETTKEEEETKTAKESESKTEKESESQNRSSETKDSKVSESSKADTSKTDTKPTETTAPTTTPKEETKPVHTHSYDGVVTTQANCTVSGVKTYTCQCGDTYTENLGTTAHNFTEPVYGTVHHDEVWQNVPRTVTTKVIVCGCGERFTSQEEKSAHAVASIDAGNFACGMFSDVEETTETVYDYVKVSDAWDEQVIVSYKCSVCGQAQ